MRGEIAARGSVRGTVTHEVHVQGSVSRKATLEGNMAMEYGTPGKDGITPHIGENLNWFVGEVDTGIRAVGEDGYTPVKGVDYFDGEPGKDGYTPQKGIDYFDGKDGNDYVLTEADKQEIAGMVEVPEGGTVTDEQIASAVEDYFAENPVTGGGLTDEQISALDNMFKVCAFIKADVSAEYNAFCTAFGIEGGIVPDEPDIPDIPDEPEEPHTHSYTSSETKAATCETDGVRTYTCSCGHSYTEAIPATGHNYVDGTCTNCGAADPNAGTGGGDSGEYETVNIPDVAEIRDGYRANGLDSWTEYGSYRCYVITDVKAGDTFAMLCGWNGDTNYKILCDMADGTVYDATTDRSDVTNHNYSYGSYTWVAQHDYETVYINTIRTSIDNGLNAGAAFTWTRKKVEEPDIPEKTLTSISATYSGGDVTVDTAVTALTGIVVTAHYSDGSTEPVTGYTLSGTIAEGSNTITVSYGGMTTTFTVTGVAESGGGDSGDSGEYETVNILDVATVQESKCFDSTKLGIKNFWNRDLYTITDVKSGDVLHLCGAHNANGADWFGALNTDGTYVDLVSEITDWDNHGVTYGTGTWTATKDYAEVYISPIKNTLMNAIEKYSAAFTWTRKKVE